MRTLSNSIYALILAGIFILGTSIAAQAQRKIVSPTVQRATVLINEQGYSRSSIKLRRGVPARLTFLRQTENTCATEIVIPAYGINRPLPMNQRVTVSFTPRRVGEFRFTCGMNMMNGKLVVL